MSVPCGLKMGESFIAVLRGVRLQRLVDPIAARLPLPVEFRCRVDPQSHAEVARSELQIIGHFDAALATVKGSAFSSKRDGLRTPMTVVAGRIPGILRQRPMPDELRFGGEGRWNQQASPGSEYQARFHWQAF